MSEKNRRTCADHFSTLIQLEVLLIFFTVTYYLSKLRHHTNLFSVYVCLPMRSREIDPYEPSCSQFAFYHDLFKVLFLLKACFWVSFKTRQMPTLEDCRKSRPPNVSAFDKLRMRFKNPYLLQLGPCIIFPICTKIDTAVPWVLSNKPLSLNKIRWTVLEICEQQIDRQKCLSFLVRCLIS